MKSLLDSYSTLIAAVPVFEHIVMYPHHQHIGEALEPSTLHSLRDVLEFLGRRILP